jgi:arylsulfatase A-like enzyme
MMGKETEKIPSAGHRIIYHMSIGSTVSLGFGFCLGLILSVRLASLDTANFVLKGWTHWTIMMIFLGAMGAVVLAMSLFPLEIALGIIEKQWSGLRRLRLFWFYLATAMAFTGFIHSCLLIAFDLVPDVTTPEGIITPKGVMAISIAGGIATLFVVLVAIITRNRSMLPFRRASGRFAVFTMVLIVVLSGIGWMAYRTLVRPVKVSFSSPPTQAHVLPIDASTKRQRRPDVLIVSIDTLRADHLGCYGYKLPTSPNLDEFAIRAVRFIQARSPSPWTLPSHATMMTGLYPSTHGARFYSHFRWLHHANPIFSKLGGQYLTLAEILRDAGYETKGFTSTTWLNEVFGVMQGFDTLEFRLADLSATQAVDHALDWLSYKSKKPKLIFLHIFDVHNYFSPKSYETRFVKSNYKGKLSTNIRSLIANNYEYLSDADLSYARGKYDAAISYVDAELGRLFSELQKSGHFDNTLIVITADHGEEFWEHGGTGHGFTLYEEQIRIPLFVKPPSIFPVRHRAPEVSASLVDLVPTVVDYVGLSNSVNKFEGISLRPYIETDAQIPKREVFAEDTYFFNSYAVISGHEKYIHNRIPPAGLFNPGLFVANVRSFYKFREPEFYRLDIDPSEKKNLARDMNGSHRYLLDSLLAHVSRMVSTKPIKISKKAIKELRSLGYIK